MAEQESPRGGISLRRSSSAHQHRVAGPQKLLRTVSQRLKGLIAATTATDATSSKIVISGNQGSTSSRLFFGRDDHGGECSKILPMVDDRSSNRWTTLPGFFLNSLAQKFQGTGRTSDEDDEIQEVPSLGCFGKIRRSGSMREKLVAHDLSSSSGSSRRNPCAGCFGSTPLAEDQGNRSPDSSTMREENLQAEEAVIVLPDDILEMCLARLPFDSLVRARAVCKKWRSLTRSSHFSQLRDRMESPRPWLFLLGLSKDGVCLGQIQAFDPTLDRWHSMRADSLAGRLLYSAASAGSKLFVVGGCSARVSGDKGGFLKTHKSVLVLDAFTGQWSKAAGMKSARTTPVVGAFEMSETVRLKLFVPDRRKDRERRRHRSGEIGVFRGESSSAKLMEMMGRRCVSQSQRGTIYPETSASSGHRIWELYRETIKNPGSGSSPPATSKRCYGLIVIGGQDERNQTLDSGEVYDPVSDSWKEISPWPAEFGSLCTGVVVKTVFYGYSDSDNLVALDIERNSWHAISIANSAIPSRLQDYLPKLVVCKGRVLLVGVAWASRSQPILNGFEQAKAARKLWRLDQPGKLEWRWAEVSQHPDAPLDWNAVFVGHGDRIYALEMFKIFGQVLDFVTVCEFAASQHRRAVWDRVSKRRMGQDVDSSSCLTKTAVIVQL